MKIYDAINKGMTLLNGIIDEPRLEAELLLSFVLHVDKLYVIVNKDKELNPIEENHYFSIIEKRKNHVPYHYIVGKKNFMGLDFLVNDSVLIPRDDTEILVLETLKRINSDFTILDIGTGCGAISISLAKYKDVLVYAVDISRDALDIAKKNALINNVYDKIIFLESDIFSNVPKDIKFDYIISNPPYIKSGDISNLQLEVKKEPILALDGGADGLFFYRRIISDAKKFLKKSGAIAFEIGYDEAESVKNLFNEAGFKKIEIIKDMQGYNRVIIGN